MSLVFAHRGFSGRYPENTMLAFEQAIQARAHGIELDVHLSQDNVAVIIHDETLDRTCHCPGLVSAHTVAQLQAMDASAGFAGQFPPCPVPTLEAYFQLVAELPLITNVELKTNVNPYPGIEQIVVDLIHAYHLEQRVILSSFNHHTILRVQQLDPQLKTGLLCGSWLVNPGQYTAAVGAQAYHPAFRSITPEMVDEVHRHGLELNTYTVNTPEDATRLAQWGVDGIITNYPDMVGTVLSQLD